LAVNHTASIYGSGEYSGKEDAAILQKISVILIDLQQPLTNELIYQSHHWLGLTKNLARHKSPLGRGFFRVDRDW
jgi:hypothetical protein